MKIKTNKHWRSFKSRHEVPAKILKSEFDWLNPDDYGWDDGFIHYRGWWYHLSQFERSPSKEWDGAHPDSCFSGILIKLSDDGESYRIGTYFS